METEKITPTEALALAKLHDVNAKISGTGKLILIQWGSANALTVPINNEMVRYTSMLNAIVIAGAQ